MDTPGFGVELEEEEETISGMVDFRVGLNMPLPGNLVSS